MEEEEYQLFKFSVPLETREIEVNMGAGKEPVKGKQRAVALIGDRFYQGKFFPAEELEKAYKQWEGTLHDINHMGTHYPTGFTVTPNILYFVGYNSNVTFDKETKSMSMDVNIVDTTYLASSWRGYVQLCEESNQTPNVSVAFLARVKTVRASDLPKGVDYKSQGYSAEDEVMYIHDIKPQALSTVLKGACDDQQGCGINHECNKDECTCSESSEEDEGEETISISKEEEEQMEKEKQEILDWLKRHQ
jgi:hypothetical protein